MKWVKFSTGIVLALIGFILLANGYGGVSTPGANRTSGTLTMFLGLLLAGGGGLLVYLFLKDNSGGGMPIANATAATTPGQAKSTGRIDTLVVSPRDVTFESMGEVDAIKHQSRNDGKWYQLVARDADGKVTDFVLPDIGEDSQYYDPREFANVVTMAANKVLFEPRAEKFKQVAVGLMVVAIAVLGIVIVAMGG